LNLKVAGVLLRLLVSVACIGAMMWWVGPDLIVSHLRRVGAASFCLSALLVLLLAIPHALRWRIINQVSGADRSVGWTLRGVLLGQFFNQLLPSMIGGDVARAWYAARGGVPLAAAIRSVLIDRVCGAVVTLLLSVCVLPLWFQLPGGRPLAWTIAVLGVAGFSGLALMMVIDRLLVSRGSIEPSHALPHRVFWRLVGQVIELGPMARAALTRLLVLFYSALALAATISLFYLDARLLGLDIGPLALIMGIPPTIAIAMVPISFAGWGIREGVLIAVLHPLGVPADAALALSVLYGLTVSVAAAVAGGLSALSGGARWLSLRPRAFDDAQAKLE